MSGRKDDLYKILRALHEDYALTLEQLTASREKVKTLEERASAIDNAIYSLQEQIEEAEINE